MPARLPFAREGVPVIATVAGVLGLVATVGTAAGHPIAVLPLVLALGFSLWFFRDPERQPPLDDALMVSPADGRVLDVTPMREETFLKAPATRISIFMSPLDVHVNRAPLDGTVEEVRHTDGRFRAAFADKASVDNERTAMVLRSHGRRFLVVQIAGAVARRIVCHRTAGDQLRRGERYGMIMFGSRVDVYVPPDVTPRVGRGDRVVAGATVIAELPRGAA
ncbi:MAG: phosphatidylserine decarboxylase family protein [bacterium]|nr:phosphatidylserine decarboxylase family protein [bacterium]